MQNCDQSTRSGPNGKRTVGIKGGVQVGTQNVVGLFLGCICLVTAQPAMAYLDPGAGSIFLQILLGGIGGLVVLAKLYWYRILSVLGLGSDKQEPDPQESDTHVEAGPTSNDTIATSDSQQDTSK